MAEVTRAELEAMLMGTTERSEVDEFVLPTSFRTSRLRADCSDKIPTQLARLSGLLENMMDKLRDNSDSDDCAFGLQENTLKVASSISDFQMERLQMRLEDAGECLRRLDEERETVREAAKRAQEKLALALAIESLGREFSSDSETEVAKKVEGVLMLAQHAGLPLDAILTNSLSSQLGSAQRRVKELEAAEAVFATELRILKRHIENLSGQKLNSLSGNWTWEVPAFCKNVLQLFSSESKAPCPSSPPGALKVNCTISDLHLVVARLCDMLEEWEASGSCKEFGLQLGMVAVTVVVEQGEVDTESSSLSEGAVLSLAETIACRREGAQTDRQMARSPAKEIDRLAYIHQLEEKVVDLQSQLNGADCGGQTDVESINTELETKLEEVMYRLSLATQQITKLKQGKYSPEEERMEQNYKLKCAEVLLREETLKEQSQRLAIEKEQLRLTAAHFEAEKEAFFRDHDAAVGELEAAFAALQKSTADAGVQADPDPRIQELETTCRLLQEEIQRSQSVLASQQVMRKESGQWVNQGTHKELARKIQLLSDELERGCDPLHLPSICRRLQNVKSRLESVSLLEEVKTETGELLFSLSREEGRSWSEASPEFSVSRIEQQREELTADLKVKEEQMEALKEELRKTEESLLQTKRECEELREERMRSARKEDEIEVLRQKLEEFIAVRTTEVGMLTEVQQVEMQKTELAQKVSAFETEKSSFRDKRSQLREKIDQINERQKKLLSKEKLLSEKETLLLLQEKKVELHKQGVDQLWKENDEKRHELAKCQRVIDDEWKVLMEETRQFEALKVAEKRLKLQWDSEKQEFDVRQTAFLRESEQVQLVAAKLARDKEAMEAEKAKVRSERAVLEGERQQLLRAKKALFDQRTEAPSSDCRHPRREAGDSRRELAAMIPALQCLLRESEDDM